MVQSLYRTVAALLFLLLQTYAGIRPVRVITVDGTISPASADFIHEEIGRAAEHNAECLVIRLNTPGGLLKSTRAIVSDFLSSPLPIVVYVSPGGSQAASAGVFVTMAGHVAAMAPGTNIGAAHPVTMGEQADSVMMSKATNDAAAFIRTICDQRHRNGVWGEKAVRSSVSLTEQEALKEHVIDTVAASVEELLKFIDGKECVLASGPVVLHTRDAAIETISRSTAEKILDILSDPNIAYILMMLGVYGILFELYNPGLIFPGIIGVVSLILAFYSFHTLPINYAGLSLVVFGIILFILEIKVVSHGMLTGGGILSLLIGSLMLIRKETPFDIIGLSLSVILSSVVVSALFFIFIIGMGIRAQKLKPTTGTQGLIGEIGETISRLDPAGLVRIHGETWSAVSAGGPIDKGMKVRAEGLENLRLTVRKLES